MQRPLLDALSRFLNLLWGETCEIESFPSYVEMEEALINSRSNKKRVLFKFNI